VVAQQLFTTVKRGNAIAQKLENGSSNHGEPFFLKPHPSPLQRRGREGERKKE